MELKRFVLLETNVIWDLGSEKNPYGYAFNRYTSEHIDMHYDHFEELDGNLILSRGSKDSKLINKIGIIKKTSDNILDLVDIGDMLLRNDDFCYHIIVTDISGDTFYGEHESIWRGNTISHLWKRQTNGDYKLYEVSVK